MCADPLGQAARGDIFLCQRGLRVTLMCGASRDFFQMHLDLQWVLHFSVSHNQLPAARYQRLARHLLLVRRHVLR